MIVAKLGGMSYTSGAKTSITVGTSTFDVSHCTDARWFSFIDVWVVCLTRVSSAWSTPCHHPPHTREHTPHLDAVGPSDSLHFWVQWRRCNAADVCAWEWWESWPQVWVVTFGYSGEW